MNLFILLFSSLISVLCFWFGTKFILLYLKVKGWQRTEARILSKKIELAKKTSVSRARFLVYVEYTYSFHEKPYNNNKVYLIELVGGQVNHLQTSAQKVVGKLEDTVSIYVNPANPQKSVIFCDSLWLYLMILAFGIISILVGIGNYL